MKRPRMSAPSTCYALSPTSGRISSTWKCTRYLFESTSTAPAESAVAKMPRPCTFSKYSAKVITNGSLTQKKSPAGYPRTTGPAPTYSTSTPAATLFSTHPARGHTPPTNRPTEVITSAPRPPTRHIASSRNRPADLTSTASANSTNNAWRANTRVPPCQAAHGFFSGFIQGKGDECGPKRPIINALTGLIQEMCRLRHRVKTLSQRTRIELEPDRKGWAEEVIWAVHSARFCGIWCLSNKHRTRACWLS